MKTPILFCPFHFYACTLSLGHSGVLWGAWLSPPFWFPYCPSSSLADFHVCTFRFAENCYWFPHLSAIIFFTFKASFIVVFLYCFRKERERHPSMSEHLGAPFYIITSFCWPQASLWVSHLHSSFPVDPPMASVLTCSGFLIVAERGSDSWFHTWLWNYLMHCFRRVASSKCLSQDTIKIITIFYLAEKPESDFMCFQCWSISKMVFRF